MSAHTPTLGVLITYYNERELLTECLNSILLQEDAPDEIWVYDDASSDPPEPYIPDLKRVKVIKGTENRGPSFGRNQLLQACTCDYIHFHDSDDWFKPDWARSVRKLQRDKNLDAIFTEISSYENGRLKNENVQNISRLIEMNNMLKFCLQGVLLVPSGTYKRELVQRIHGYRTSIWQSEDLDFHLRLSLTRPNFECINEALISIRIHDQSRSQRVDECHRDSLFILEDLADRIPGEYRKDLADMAVRSARSLYLGGYREDARMGFELAQEWGPPTYSEYPVHYRIAARMLGPMRAERIGKIYRTVVPKVLREDIRGT